MRPMSSDSAGRSRLPSRQNGREHRRQNRVVGLGEVARLLSTLANPGCTMARTVRMASGCGGSVLACIVLTRLPTPDPHVENFRTY